MDTNQEFRSYMQAASTEIDGHPGRCLTESELIGYREGLSGELERDRIQAHLSRCVACRQTFLDMVALFDPPGEGERPSAVTIRSEWKGLKRRLSSQSSVRPKWWPWLTRDSALAIAAGLFLVAALTTLWTFRVRQNTSHVERALHEKILKLEQLASAVAVSEGERQVTASRMPQANAQLYDAFPADAGERAGATEELNRIRQPADAPAVIVLVAARLPAYRSYAIEIVGSADHTIWRGDDVRPDTNGNFVLILPPGFVGPGDYTVRLLGRAAAQFRLLTVYRIKLVRPTASSSR